MNVKVSNLDLKQFSRLLDTKKKQTDKPTNKIPIPSDINKKKGIETLPQNLIF